MKPIIVEITDYLCDDCETDLRTRDGWPSYNVGNDHYCMECAVKRGLLDPLSYVSRFGDYHHATYKDGVITAYRKWGRGYRKDEIKV